MADSLAIWTPATTADAADVLELMRAFYVEEQLVFADSPISAAVSSLLASSDIGALFLLKQDEKPCGYFMATYGFSAEFGGRFVLLDELYLKPGARGSGEGKRAIAFAEAWARNQNISTLRVEVNHHNEKALAIYLKSGFVDGHRRILTKWLVR